MRVFAVSDLHIDYEENLHWAYSLSQIDYTNDILILAGDISSNPGKVDGIFHYLARCFGTVLFVPGNHDLWVSPRSKMDSIQKFEMVRTMAGDNGIITTPFETGNLSIVPLLGWYDYTFGPPPETIKERWMDYRMCKWPDGFDDKQVTDYFVSKNEPFLATQNKTLISFSHFMPRIDLMPSYIPKHHRFIYPVLGTHQLELQVRRLNSNIHIYGHSHVNRKIRKDNTTYINNAFGYPHEKWTTDKVLRCVYKD